MPVVVTRGPAPQDDALARAVAAVRDGLPTTDPYRVWRHHELRDAEGRRHAVPLLVLARNGLWVVAIDTHAGALEIDEEIWLWEDDGPGDILESPFAGAKDVARRLREALARAGHVHLQVRSIVLLGDPDARLKALGDSPVRSDLVAHPDADLPGVPSVLDVLLADPESDHAVARRDADAIAEALPELGFVEAPKVQVVDGYRFGALLAEHSAWQEHAAENAKGDPPRLRIRTWTLPQADEPKRRAALQQAAAQEAEILDLLGRHPNILGLVRAVESEGDLPRLFFERFDGGVPLNRLLRARQDLSFEQRLQILAQVAEAIDHCHRHDTFHRHLSPEAVLVRIVDGRPEVRLHRFEGAVSREIEATRVGTRHLTHFKTRVYELYRAPELHRDPDTADAMSDLFSLGALAWFLFTGRHPGPNLEARLQRIRTEDGMRLEGEEADKGLRIWRVRDDLDQELDEAVSAATRDGVLDREAALRSWVRKQLGVGAEPGVKPWINALLRLHAPDEPDAAEVAPLDAAPGDLLGQGLTVVATLGHGASARVLAVSTGDRLYALKVPHDAVSERLVDAEASVLERIDHPSVVRFEERVELSGRPCLLMQHAGEETLGDLVRRQGTLALDYVHRLGDELFEVLVHLHERGITHRDIKPSNLAFTSSGNLAHRLLMFDFSLAALPAERTEAGTPRWRDPFLSTRGAWDPAADLYAAAAVLYYALTGERPRWEKRGQRVRVVENRFDPDLRGALAGFFARAFAPESQERHADAGDMRRAWGDVFARDITSVPTDEAPADADPRLSRARLDSPIGALGLSARALNALERTGAATVLDLLGLPRNRLSLVRGVGRETRAEIGRAVDALRARLGGRQDAAVVVLLPDSTLRPLPLREADLGLADDAVETLHEAGIRTLRDLAGAGRDQVGRLLGRHGVALDALVLALGAHAQPIEGIVGDWVATLLRPNRLSKRTQWERRVCALVGLDPIVEFDATPVGGRSNGQVAAALGDTPVVFRASFASARRHWDRHPDEATAVVAAVGEALDRVGPVATISEVAEALLEARAPDVEAGRRDALVQAVALVRLTTELGIPNPAFVWRRLGRHAWLARDDKHLDALQGLASAADRLAGEQPVPLEDAHRALRPAASPPLDQLGTERVVERAVRAAAQVALSARLEVYRRELSAARAVELSAAVLAPGLDAAAIAARVATRYPDAELLPGRPELDALLQRVGLQWAEDRKAYIRPGAAGSSLTMTEAWRTSVKSLRSATPRDPDSARAERFSETLARSLEAGRFRVIQVSARRASAAVDALRRSVEDLHVVSLDGLLWKGLQERIAAAGADPDFVLGVDRDGPEGPHWDLFVEQFVAPVASEVIDALLDARQQSPVLVQHPGLLARYGLAEALDAFVRRAEDEEGEAVWLLLPSWDDAGKPLLRHPHGDVPVPVFKPAQRLRAPRAWIFSGGRTG